MLTSQRKKAILDALARDGQVLAKQLSETFEVSEDTVRRDLRELAAEGLLQRVHGGALPASSAVAPFAERREIESSAKRAIAGAAAAMIGNGQVVHRMLAKSCSERYQTMAELRTALETLRDGSGGQTPWSGTTVMRSEPQERTPMVGRDAELADLTGQLDRMLMGHGGFVLLSGEPGVGKTRLAREVQRLARARGCLTLTGQCYEQEGAPPFGPFAETVEQSLRLAELSRLPRRR